MKYLLWKYPLPISFDNEDGELTGPHPVDKVETEPQMELIDALVGESLDDVANELIDAVRADMLAVLNTTCRIFGIDGGSALEYVSDMPFDYKIHANADEPVDVDHSSYYYGIQVKKE